MKTGGKSSTDQLAADYLNAKDRAERLQQEADMAKADAEAKLVTYLAEVGLTLGAPALELVITDWRELRLGDYIWIGSSGCEGGAPEGVFEIVDFDANDQYQPVGVKWASSTWWPRVNARGWRFIRRPSKGASDA